MTSGRGDYSSDFGAGRSLAIVQILNEVLREAWRVVLDNLFGEMRVDGVDVLAKLAAWSSFDFLNALEATAFNECLLSLGVLWENLGKLSCNVC